MELTKTDLNIANMFFSILEQAAAIDGVIEIEIRVRVEGGDPMVIGYGEAAEPAILGTGYFYK